MILRMPSFTDAMVNFVLENPSRTYQTTKEIINDHMRASKETFSVSSLLGISFDEYTDGEIIENLVVQKPKDEYEQLSTLGGKKMQEILIKLANDNISQKEFIAVFEPAFKQMVKRVDDYCFEKEMFL